MVQGTPLPLILLHQVSVRCRWLEPSAECSVPSCNGLGAVKLLLKYCDPTQGSLDHPADDSMWGAGHPPKGLFTEIGACHALGNCWQIAVAGESLHIRAGPFLLKRPHWGSCTFNFVAMGACHCMGLRGIGNVG